MVGHANTPPFQRKWNQRVRSSMSQIPQPVEDKDEPENEDELKIARGISSKMTYRSVWQTSLILREDKLGERKFRVNELKHLTADLIHRDIENLADSL